MELSEALRTTGAVRDFTDEPVDDATVYRLLETARFAPNGGNRQAWRVVVVQDPRLRRTLRDVYLPGWYEYLAQVSAGLTPWAVVTDRELERGGGRGSRRGRRRGAGPGGFAERLDEVPVMLVLLADLERLSTVDREPATTPWSAEPRSTRSPGASCWPPRPRASLGCDHHGGPNETAVRAVLGVPDTHLVAGVLALGRPVHQATRLPAGTGGRLRHRGPVRRPPPRGRRDKNRIGVGGPRR